MKRLLCAAMIILLLFTGCSKGKSQRDFEISEIINVNTEITHEQRSFNAQLSADGNETRLVYTSPKLINGLCVAKNRSGCVAQLSKLKINAPENYFTEKSAIAIIDRVLSYAINNPTHLSKKRVGDVLVLTGSVEKTQFEIKAEVESSRLLEISVPTEALTVKFE